MSNTGTATTADGTRIAHQVSGGGDRTPLLLLAGQANTHRWWDRSRTDFDLDRTTVTLDWRGTGASEAPAGDWSTELLAQDAVAVLDALGLDLVDVYGTSMGGRVAQWLAIEHRARTRRLVLGCTTPGGPQAVGQPAEVLQRLSLPEPAAAQELTDLMYTPAWRAENPPPYQVLGDPDLTARARRQHRRASAGHDAWDRLPEIAAPTLILHGDADLMNPPGNAWLLASRIPNATVHFFPGARHAYFDEVPEAGRLVRDFLDREAQPTPVSA